ncbi:MAG: hypothetical protein M1813_008440 [Trichoglossum hirsutum]|nr:MAG: hypothetical protein M1813_008440 [Trichoglossum hirsutum]
MDGVAAAGSPVLLTPGRKSPVRSTNDAHPSEPESSSVSKPTPKDIYDVPITPIKPKGRINGVRSTRKQAPETPKSQASPKSASQVSPKPALQASPRLTSQASPRSVSQASASQASPKQASPKPGSLASPEPAAQQEAKPEVQSPPEPALQRAPKPELQASMTPRKGISSPVARIHYQFSFQIEKGDWVVRLRESNAPKLDEGDTWDGPFQVQELPRADAENGDSKPTLVKLKLPTGAKAGPWTDPKRLVPVHSIADTPTRGVIHLSKDTSTFLDLTTKFKPKSKKERDMFTVGKLRGKEVDENGAVKYLVHWAEYPDEDDSWESAEGIPEDFKEVWEGLHGGDGEEAALNLGRGGRVAKRGEGTAPEDHQGLGESARKRRRTAKTTTT